MKKDQINSLKSVAEIVNAAGRLTTSQFLRLRKKLDRLEEAIWQEEWKQATREARKAGITDRKIDQAIARRRRESRR